jgi:DNA-binding transcriptional MerR regulator
MDTRYSLTELAEMTHVSPRTLRFYMSKGLVDKPLGARKTAYYTHTHLQQVLTVINWQKEGLALDEILHKKDALIQTQPPRIQPGEVEVIHRIHIGSGVELNVDLVKTQLSQTQIRQLADHVYHWLAKQKESQDA